MKLCPAVGVVLACLVMFAPHAARAGEHGFFVGVGTHDFNMDAGGQVEILDVDLTSSAYRYYTPSEYTITETGLAWDDSRFRGFKPLVGYRFNDYLALAATHVSLAEKEGAETWVDPADSTAVGFGSVWPWAI